MRNVELGSRVESVTVAPQPLAVQQVGAGEFGLDICAAQMVDRAAEAAVGVCAFGEQRPGARFDAARPIGCCSRCFDGQPVQRSLWRGRPSRSASPPRRARSGPSSRRPPLGDATVDAAAASASSYRARPLERTARAYALMASPIPSPRALASRSVLSMRSKVSVLPALPRRDHQRAVRRGADSGCLLDRRGFGDGGCGGGEVAAEHEHGCARAEGKRELAERPRRARDLDAGVRQRGCVFVIPDLEGDDAALPQPAEPLGGRSVIAGEPLHRRSAERDGRRVVVGERGQGVEQDVGGRGFATG